MMLEMDMLTIFRALADETRLRILLLLQQMELAVGELALVLDQSQPRVSRHVRILVEAGLAERRKEGSWVFLRLNVTSSGIASARMLRDLLSQHDFLSSDMARQRDSDIAQLEAIRAQRAQQAAQYFAAHADEWDAIRSLHQPDDKVEAALLALLGDDLGDLLDVGTGTGRMVELLASRVDHATAVDNSPDMLRLARAKLEPLGPDRVDLLLGDFYSLPVDEARFDSVIMHQALHYADNPGEVIAQIGRALAPGGTVAIIDFAPHALEELRSRDAHARLGFADTQIRDFMAAAGITLSESSTLKGDPLTIKIWVGKAPVSPVELQNKHADQSPQSLNPQKAQSV
ncbi:ArsR/SmtB family transcription factor [Alterisphingorhabdus coralli]|uniref:Metalloregulator ArsR/SmtB family transcription factor n=1 Tax=Alterisphingorhabdus coralli TaxID=3071408 RepID=A0AA97F932_9SPHN|nr:metalloregulator ArsR/SmtB family transcription factor [Parasphingorhabdus sp. SCSIO 66989]WOE75786.1 metalloregulator ArsR/SmtB family transcription factor [Parasphingorhabdus sp. SCSIO 66989]